MNEPVEGQAIRRDVLIALDYSYNQEDWVYPLADALQGVTAQEAVWKPNAEVPSIWEIVLHMTVWTENIVQRMEQRMRGESPGRPSEGAWPPLPHTTEASAWEDAKQRLWESLSALRAHIEVTPLAPQLDQGNVGYSQLSDLLCRFLHLAYHIGQITKLREWRATQGITG